MNELAFSPVLAEAGSDLIDFLHKMPGPQFLGLYLGWFVVVFAVVLILRRRGHDTLATSFGGFLCFEALGGARLAAGSAYGMHKWGFLIAMMIVGGLVFFLRAKHHEHTDGSSGGWWIGCSGGSSGSGGGCGGGGGGCGGCGGCGG